MPANPERGEVEIVLGGIGHPMRPTFEALIEIEMGTQQKIVPLFRNFSLGEWGVHDLAVIVTAGMHGAGEPAAKVATVGKMLVKEGIANDVILNAVRQFLLNAMSGGADPGEAAAADQK